MLVGRGGVCLCAIAGCALLLLPGRDGMALRTAKLNNGVQVVAVRTAASGLAAVDIWLHAGAALEAAGEEGAAHFLEHMLFKGTPTRKTGTVDFAIETCGGMANAGTTRDAAHVFVTVDSRSLGTVLPVLADALQHPALDPDEMSLERSVILDEFARRLDAPSVRVQDTAFRLAYPDTPLARPILGTPEQIRTLSVEALRAFHARTYRPDRCVVAVAGDVSLDGAVAAVEAAFAGWQIGGSVAETGKGGSKEGSPVAQWKPCRAGPALIPSVGGEPAREIVVWRTPPAGNADEMLAAELTALLLQAAATTETSFEDEYAVEVVHSLQGGVLCVRYAPRDRRVLTRVEDTLKRLAQAGPSAAELSVARRTLAGQYMYETETADGVARLVGHWSILGDASVPVNIQARLDGISATAIRNFAARVLPPATEAPAEGRSD